MRIIHQQQNRLADLEKELEYYFGLTQAQITEIDELKQQLAEKEKEIEEYDNYFKSFGCKNFNEFQELIGLTKISKDDKNRDNIIHHQVCDEIREWCQNDWDYDDFMYFLDKIEKGE